MRRLARCCAAQCLCHCVLRSFFSPREGRLRPPSWPRSWCCYEPKHVKANRQPTIENGQQWWSATPPGRKRLPRGIPGGGTKEKKWCCAARRSRTAGNSRRTAAEVRPARSAVSECERRRCATHEQRLGRPHRRCNGNGAVCAGASATIPDAAAILAAAAAPADDAAGDRVPGWPVLARGVRRGSQPRLRLRKQLPLAAGAPQ